MADGSLGEIAEVSRLQAHFAWVLTLLRAQPVGGRDAGWLARRARSLDVLERYAERGLFPRNETGTGCMVPVFIDRVGTPCAVAELMLRSDFSDLAARVRERMNLDYVPAFAVAMPEDVAAFADGVGLTVAELRLIQPVYECDSENECKGCCVDPDCLESSAEECPCEPFIHDDGRECTTSSYRPGTCEEGGVCVAVPPLPEPDDGCFVTAIDPVTGSFAPLLAALFVISVARRRRG